ncbi:uncharacterized protein LOC118413691 [Branchiostoma floridae]|uniref:Uncharacterized protein LOC118413691 n=1 Tax=Branchiostoma floridae TaxID=7739 RepID=A0A9J7MMA4_BRAFL|nr:uncharacterized protein LOC118413691 [Branchiostoma floridae]
MQIAVPPSCVHCCTVPSLCKMARNLPDSGEVVRISEIFLRGAEELDGQAVRVMGKVFHGGMRSPTLVVYCMLFPLARLETHDIIGCTAELSNVERSKNSSPHQQLSVDTRLIEPFQARLGSIFQMIGETEFTAGGPLLHARVVRCVDGIDTAVYYKALDMQRQYLKERLSLYI